jgi:hypothetical protein
MKRGLLVASLLLVACYPSPRTLRDQTSKGPIPGGGGSGGTAGTGGSGGTMAPSDAGPVVDAAARPDAALTRPCADYAAAYCARFRACSAAQEALFFGDEGLCRQRVTLECALVELPEVTWPTRACVDSLPTLACDEMLRGDYGAACRTAGALDDGTACFSPFQCQSRRCAQRVGDACSSCVPRGQAGDPCSSGLSCQDQLDCNARKACAMPRIAGENCDDDRPCLVPLLCRGGSCVARGGEGAACASAEDCDGARGLGCNPVAGKCVRFTVTTTCRTLSDGTFEACQAAGSCQVATGTCVAAARDGESCSDELGPHCLLPAVCRAGRCTLPAACP